MDNPFLIAMGTAAHRMNNFRESTRRIFARLGEHLKVAKLTVGKSQR
jgi:hypothetical protein